MSARYAVEMELYRYIVHHYARRHTASIVTALEQAYYQHYYKCLLDYWTRVARAKAQGNTVVSRSANVWGAMDQYVNRVSSEQHAALLRRENAEERAREIASGEEKRRTGLFRSTELSQIKGFGVKKVADLAKLGIKSCDDLAGLKSDAVKKTRVLDALVKDRGDMVARTKPCRLSTVGFATRSARSRRPDAGRFLCRTMLPMTTLVWLRAKRPRVLQVLLRRLHRSRAAHPRAARAARAT